MPATQPTPDHPAEVDRLARFLLQKIRASPDGLTEREARDFDAEVGDGLGAAALAQLLRGRAIIKARIFDARAGRGHWAYLSWFGGAGGPKAAARPARPQPRPPGSAILARPSPE